ncbi:95374ac5-b99f-496c-8d37-40c2e9d6fd1b [Thermothielavioides terrestris]|uniref:95374ac5-b99f-496c-8d37-40c2e9d6fd1b n=1 Tax=Thermothielavioides terrestris TaxID=2587410 RepID=A0A446BMA1_9PEZI|nr:95374ac5-b99f-496c-8d37-40c2e9d6fd1b [Thermothielavioides terrestris]
MDHKDLNYILEDLPAIDVDDDDVIGDDITVNITLYGAFYSFYITTYSTFYNFDVIYAYYTITSNACYV